MLYNMSCSMIEYVTDALFEKKKSFKLTALSVLKGKNCSSIEMKGDRENASTFL